MRAKRLKKHRKTMDVFKIHHNFHVPYQVLCTSSFLRSIHVYHMPTPKFLENTLGGQVIPYITQCTLAKVMEGYTGTGKEEEGKKRGRPDYLPPPQLVPLRYCKHKDEQGEERGVISETECLYDLISGGAKGNEARRNKQHFIIAAADWDEAVKDEKELARMKEQRNKRRKLGEDVSRDIRDYARTVPGVPIVYVKRSVMVLEEPSLATLKGIRGVEKEKFRDGIGGAARGQKRGAEEVEDESDSGEEEGGEAKSEGSKAKKAKGTSGPNPLSMRKKKTKVEEDGVGETVSKKKRSRGKRGKGGGGENPASKEAIAAAADSA